MTSALDDDELALSIDPSHTRRGSTRSPSEQSSLNDPLSQSNATPTPRGPSSTSQSAASHSRNSRLGQYQVLKTLGEGSFGKVKLAVHAVSKQKVALKIINRRKLLARDMAGRVEREIQYLQLLRHPHIIKLYTVITTPTEIIMVLEYAGSELFNYIVDHGKMVEDKARLFFQQIVCAVEYCHRHKIVHRDLKPENLLLDENLHVKIADFGLSNIMTDGNFLKTSCGSPNYAAPEVISGKLYAGSEVDVWSCGVILYVLLVGRLPFDDEYIPALFKKIAQGNYHVPQFLPQGAARLIRKMLQVSPVQRITVQEIRQDPWFVKNLPDYLQPPVEEFIDTGVDPSKPIDPRSLAPSKSSEVVDKLHNSVVGKLGKTMGYGREDVQQALAVDEPNAIKDAYLIVRENQIMRDTPSMARDPSLQPFLAQSPPVSSQSPISSMAESGARSISRSISDQGHRPHASSPLGQPSRQIPRNSQPQAISPGESRRKSVNAATITDIFSPASSNIAVLPSSLPDYHRLFMAGQPKPSSNEDDGSQSQQEPADSAARARRLNPHSRSSQLNLERLNKPVGMTPLNPPEKKKTKPMKWQFGIRSKNHAAEAMLAIYRALKAMGADWEVPRTRKPGEGESDQSPSRDNARDEDAVISGSEDGSDYDHDDSDESDSDLRRNGNGSFNSSTRGRSRMQYGSWNDWGYAVPDDPWVINARFRKGDMLPPGVLNAGSAHSSHVDLTSSISAEIDHADALRRRSSTLSSNNSAGASGDGLRSSGASGSNLDSQANISSASNANSDAGRPSSISSTSASQQVDAASKAPGTNSDVPPRRVGFSSASLASAAHELASSKGSTVLADDSAYIYLTIQLYAIEKETYLVDFKCAGYERVVRRLVREVQDQADAAAGGSTITNERSRAAANGDTDSDADSDKDSDNDDDAAMPKFESGRPREAGNWDAMRAMRSGRPNGSRDASPSRHNHNGDAADGSRPGASAVGASSSSSPAAARETGVGAASGSNGNGGGGRGGGPYTLREELMPRGRAVEEKDVSSPFPFLDVASRLIIQLARAD